MKPKVESIQDKHLAEIEALFKEHTDIFDSIDHKILRKDLLIYLSEKPNHPTKKAYILVQGNNILGLIMYSHVPESEGYYKIDWLAIKKGEENNGFGKLLIKEAFRKIRKLGGEYVFVETSYEKHNEKAKRFYKSMGMKQMGVLPEYYPPLFRGTKKSEDYVIYFRSLN